MGVGQLMENLKITPPSSLTCVFLIVNSISINRRKRDE